jgi:hypothetical protein
VIDFPYSVAVFPLKAFGLGVEAAAEAVDESPRLRRLARLFPLALGPARVSGGISVGTGDGFGANASVDVPEFGASRHAVKLRLGGQTRGERRAMLGLRLRRSDLSWFEVAGGYRSDHNARFWGFGPASPESAESFHRREVSWGGVTWRRLAGGGDFGGALTGLYSSVAATGSDHSDAPHLSEEFAGALPPGYRDRSHGLTAGVELAHENGDRVGPPGHAWRERARPERGGSRRVSASWFEGKGNARVRFWTWRAEAQQFLAMPFSGRALALRAFVSRIENEGEDPVPFQRLMTNDDPDVFRGYEDERFRDLGILAMAAEYRWPAWSLKSASSLGVDAYLFTDWGQVFSDVEQIGGGNLTSSWGGGLRLGAEGLFVGRIEVGASEEGLVFRLRADQVFQFEKGGLFAGRDPVPDR